jgi:alginate O-acetyltransferase complex protein AlgI
MVFSSSLFLFFFLPCFLLCYFLVPNNNKNAVIIISSLFFYAWGANYFIIIVIITGFIDYKLGNIIKRTRNIPEHVVLYRFCIFIDIIINIGLLIYFKYLNFFVDNINKILTVMGTETVSYTKIILPIGISFVVFQKLTYCLDIAKGQTNPVENFQMFIEYLLVFPQIIAGPILKYNILSSQLKNRVINCRLVTEGFERFAIGLFKKVWIADVLAKYADIAFHGPANTIPIYNAWFGIICYSLQIYFDFSAYSDMAIGLLKIMNFSIPENFNHPYISKNINEFWKRWHISLTSWMREYIYIPLGGNRKGNIRTYVNYWIVFLISGFWHGASWNFVLWGIYHGTLLCMEKIIFLKRTEKFHFIVRMGITYLLINIGWVFFRSDGLNRAFEYLYQMFNLASINLHPDPKRIIVVDKRGIFIFIVAIVMCFLPAFEKIYNNIKTLFLKNKKMSLFCYLVIFILAALKVGTATISPFIYFRF